VRKCHLHPHDKTKGGIYGPIPNARALKSGTSE
jgi:hypothetical protein